MYVQQNVQTEATVTENESFAPDESPKQSLSLVKTKSGVVTPI